MYAGIAWRWCEYKESHIDLTVLFRSISHIKPARYNTSRLGLLVSHVSHGDGQQWTENRLAGQKWRDSIRSKSI
jgi:hypothetical protein